MKDFDDKVVSKLSLLVDGWGCEEALAMLAHLEQRMRSKQGVMKNGPGYLDVAVCTHIDMLKAQGSCESCVGCGAQGSCESCVGRGALGLRVACCTCDCVRACVCVCEREF